MIIFEHLLAHLRLHGTLLQLHRVNSIFETKYLILDVKHGELEFFEAIHYLLLLRLELVQLLAELRQFVTLHRWQG
jgi:hypothetical protein